MGKIFSVSEVRGRNIPDRGAHQRVADTIKRQLTRASDSVIGALLCGSVLVGKHSVRSDVDCVVLYRQDKTRELMKVLHRITQMASAMYVPLELIPMDHVTAATHSQHIKHSFRMHLEWAVQHGGVIGRNPLDKIRDDTTSPHADVVSYCAHKLRKLEKTLARRPALSEQDYHFFLQKLLEVPVHLARKINILKGVGSIGVSKVDVAREYREWAPKPLARILGRAIQLDREYSHVLESTLQQPDFQLYCESLERIELLSHGVLEFLRGNAQLLE